MTFLVLLLVLLLQRYANFGERLHHTDWLAKYFRWPKRLAPKALFANNLFGVFLLVFPVVFIVTIIETLLNNFLFGTIDFFFELLIMWYCVNAYPLRRLSNSFAETKTTLTMEQMVPVDYVVTTSVHEQTTARNLTENLFLHSFRDIFAVWFWYIILGPIFAVLYFLIRTLHYYASAPNSDLIEFQEPVAKWLAVLDWIPVRVTALGYALMGHFVAGFNYCIRNIRAGLIYSERLAIMSGLTAMYGDQADVAIADIIEPREALSLIDRSMWLWLVIIALFTLGDWL